MNDHQESCPRLDPSHLLAMLRSEDVHQQFQALLVACPCRNRYYDKDIWRAVCEIRATTPDARIRDRANHVIGTLYERTRQDMRSVQMLRWLAEQGYALHFPPWLEREIRRRAACPTGLRLPKVTLRDVPTLIEALASEDADEQKQASDRLCPGGARQYHKKVWLAFFHACHGADGLPNAQALLATRRLLAYARSDPRAQEVLQWLRHELCIPSCDSPSDVVDALTQALEHPLPQPAKTDKRRREDPALRGGAFVEIAPLVASVYACQDPRALRKALYALRRTEAPGAFAVLTEYVDHPEPAIGRLAKSLLLPHKKDIRTPPPPKDLRPREQTEADLDKTGRIHGIKEAA